ncbi:MAG: hypothetical protein HC816_06045 [Leptolyngbyaceae cyanobacterium RM1_1_2]|nr:hypothetical protein [Leptolyngbyaceae cyanobacterium RM1_1_2]
MANGSAPTVPPDMTPTPDSPSAELIDRVIQKAAETADVAAAELRVVRYSRATWPDGCLGLAGADELCTQALVEGWQFEVAHSGNPGNGIYRSDLSGDRIRLDQSGF